MEKIAKSKIKRENLRGTVIKTAEIVRAKGDISLPVLAFTLDKTPEYIRRAIVPVLLATHQDIEIGAGPEYNLHHMNDGLE